MKTSTIPSIRVEPDLREQLQQVLRVGETLSAFVDTAVRDQIGRRLNQALFVQRGMASLASARDSGTYVSVDATIRGLEAKLAEARAGKHLPQRTEARTEERAEKRAEKRPQKRVSAK